jgi:quinoprotein glucose dehydrogenase
VLALAALPAFAQAKGTEKGEWRYWGGDERSSRYSPLDQINRTNVDRLQVAWTYESGDHFKGSEMQSNPVVMDGTLYVTTPTLHVVAIDAATGRERWKFDPSGGSGPRTRFRHRGVTVHKDRVFVTFRNFLWAIDRQTGRAIDSLALGAGSICEKAWASRSIG